jgi:hypothetical protein
MLNMQVPILSGDFGHLNKTSSLRHSEVDFPL